MFAPSLLLQTSLVVLIGSCIYGGTPPSPWLREVLVRFWQTSRDIATGDGPEKSVPWTNWAASTPIQGDWFGTTLFATPFGSLDLGLRLGKFCMALENVSAGRAASNIGGWQSEDLVSSLDPALVEFRGLLHEALAAFLRRRQPNHPHGDEDLGIAAVVDGLWVNINRPGHRNALHDHGKPTLSQVASGIYYPMMNDSTAAWGEVTSQASVRFMFSEKPMDIKPRLGLMMLFPTDLPHEVESLAPGAGARVSIAFNLRVRWLDSPLLMAAAAGDVGRIKTLVSQGADTEEPDAVLGLRAVHLAAEAAHLDVLKVLAVLGANTSALSFEGWSPLGIAAERGHNLVAQHLVGQGEDIEAKLAQSGLPPPRGGRPCFLRI